MAQRYTSPLAIERMANKRCPECGGPPVMHSDDPRFWVPRACDLLAVGVIERVEQYEADLAEVTA